jgi:hypothetical protein
MYQNDLLEHEYLLQSFNIGIPQHCFLGLFPPGKREESAFLLVPAYEVSCRKTGGRLEVFKL